MEKRTDTHDETDTSATRAEQIISHFPRGLIALGTMPKEADNLATELAGFATRLCSNEESRPHAPSGTQVSSRIGDKVIQVNFGNQRSQT